MELLKKNVHMMHEKRNRVIHVVLEEDCNLPEQQADIGKLIHSKAMLNVEEVQAGNDVIMISGMLQTAVLYASDGNKEELLRLDHSILMEEKQQFPGVVSGETVHLEWEIEELNVTVINSRKLNVKGTIRITAFVDEISSVQAAVEVHGMDEVSTLTKNLELLQLTVQKRDLLRIKEEITVPSNKPNMVRILWNETSLRATDCRILEGQLDVKGELFLFLLYEGDDAKRSGQWMEVSVPFQGNVACREAMKEMIPQIKIELASAGVEIQADYDGERRLLNLEAVLDLDIRLFREEQVQVLEDVFCPLKNLIPVRESQVYESLLMKNFSKVRSNERIRLADEQPRMLQICSGRGCIHMEQTRITEEGIEAAGVVSVNILYVSSDDLVPYAVLTGEIPFKQLIEIKDLDADCRFHLQTELEQLSITMIDSEEVEVKVCVDLNTFVVRVQEEAYITSIKEEALDRKKQQELPGIVGYIVQPEDSLWELSKQYLTTPEQICKINGMRPEEIIPGTQLILLKTVS